MLLSAARAFVQAVIRDNVAVQASFSSSQVNDFLNDAYFLVKSVAEPRARWLSATTTGLAMAAAGVAVDHKRAGIDTIREPKRVVLSDSTSASDPDFASGDAELEPVTFGRMLQLRGRNPAVQQNPVFYHARRLQLAQVSGDDVDTPGGWEFWVHPMPDPTPATHVYYLKLLAVLEPQALDNDNDVFDLDESESRSVCYLAAQQLARIAGAEDGELARIGERIDPRLQLLIKEAQKAQKLPPQGGAS